MASDRSATTKALAERAARHASLGDPSRLAIVDALALSDRSPSDLGDELGIPSNLLAHHLGVLEHAGLVVRTPSHGDGRRRYLRLVPGALDGLAPPPRAHADSLLFVCTHNAARSQLAAALWRRRSEVPAESAGSDPATRVHPEALRVGRRHGLDLSRARPRGYGHVRGDPGLVVSVCDRAEEAHPPFRAPRLHWSIADPVESGERAAFEAVYDELEHRVERLARALCA